LLDKPAYIVVRNFWNSLNTVTAEENNVVWELYVKHLFLHWFKIVCAETYICV